MQPNITSRWLCYIGLVVAMQANAAPILDWSELPELPPPAGQSLQPGLAGAFNGVHNDALIVAGGANFPRPVWETDKVWHDDLYVLVKEPDGAAQGGYRWITGFKLNQPLAYGASVSTSQGVICLGGNDAKQTYANVFLLQWHPKQERIIQTALRPLPEPCAYTSAVLVGESIYVVGGTTGSDLATATRHVWCLDLSQHADLRACTWESILPWPGPTRAFALAAAQHNGLSDCLYVMSGRRMETQADGQAQAQFLTDVYEFTPALYEHDRYDPESDSYTGEHPPWRQRGDLPRCVMAGTALHVGQSHILVLGGADGSLFLQADALKDEHPGFPKEALLYHTITNTWTSAGSIPANHVTTTAVRWGNDTVHDPIVIPSGELRRAYALPE